MSVSVQREEFDVGREVAALTRGQTHIGAVVTFTGLVRGNDEGTPISEITLEHYPGMTEAELKRIESEAQARWSLDKTRLIHRYGTMKPGDPIVLVITAARHRQAAFEAAEFLMDYLKTRAPFWKKETRPDGSGTWVDARQSDDASADRWQGVNAGKDETK